MNGEPLILIERACRVGVTVQLVDRGPDDDEDNRWETICVDHGGVCSHETRKLVRKARTARADRAVDSRSA